MSEIFGNVDSENDCLVRKFGVWERKMTENGGFLKDMSSKNVGSVWKLGNWRKMTGMDGIVGMIWID